MMGLPFPSLKELRVDYSCLIYLAYIRLILVYECRSILPRRIVKIWVCASLVGDGRAGSRGSCATLSCNNFFCHSRA